MFGFRAQGAIHEPGAGVDSEGLGLGGKAQTPKLPKN